MSAEGARLRPTETIDADHPAVVDFARRSAAGATTGRETAVALFRAVRDTVRYDAYRCLPTVETLRASATLAAGRSWCVPKAILLAACCRALGIPARLGFRDVRNHLTTPRLAELMGTDVFAWHGYASILLEGRWVKATPAFDARLCEQAGLRPVEFDGRSDSLFHPEDREGRRHLEYLADRGEFDDTPVEAIRATFESEYPALMALARRVWRRRGAGAPDFGADLG